MNTIALSFLWCAWQVTIVCSIALILQCILRRCFRHALISTSTTALIVVLGLTAFSLSPWPRWSSGQQPTVSTLPTNLGVPDLPPQSASSEQAAAAVVDILIADQANRKDESREFLRHVKEFCTPWASLAFPLLLLSLTLGGIRFFVGLHAIHRTVRRARVINDQRLTEMLTELQSTLGCNRSIRFLESDQVDSPATVGWLQPAVLFPAAWRNWSMDQTRAVLAHEMAHIVRGDFGSLVLAQLSIVFHFYHPLVHRLVQNLRLEQELAADAVASFIVGGNQKYLAVLAAMALYDQPLRTQSRQSPWPARPFLPAPKTLLRRIEMLQAPHPSKKSVPTRARIAAAAIILLTGIAVAGIRPVTSVAQEANQSLADDRQVIDETDTATKPQATIKDFGKRKWRDLTATERDDFWSLTGFDRTKLTVGLRHLSERDDLRSLIDRWNRENPDDPEIQNLYATYLIDSGDIPNALPVLRELAEQNPLRGLQAAAVARKLKLFEEADSIALKSLNQMTAMSAKDPANLSVSLALAQNQLFLKRYTEAIQTLFKAIKLAKTPKDSELARDALGDAIVEFIGYIEGTSNGTVAERVRILKMLQVAMVEAPDNPQVLTAIFNELVTNLNDDNREINDLRKALAEGVPIGTRHLIKGIDALNKNDNQIAVRELQLALQQMPSNSAVMNNLAIALLGSAQVNPEEPLKMINNAIKLATNPPPHYYETRGQVLMRMERYQDAIPDLERALAVDKLMKKTHENLAVCYEKIGDPDLGKLYAQAAKDLEEKSQ